MDCTTVFLALAAASAAVLPSFSGRAPSPVGAPGAVGQGPAWGYPESFGSAAFAYPGAGGANAPVMGMPAEPSCPPTNGMVPLYVPDPDDCTKYTVCSGGFGMKLDCPPGLHFNKHENHCDFPPNARCEGGGGRGGSKETVKTEHTYQEENSKADVICGWNYGILWHEEYPE
ncbi:hypothetical protein HPB48_005803 [Haemaphysalis longicornis]|uniref:Chitin-binding type-2 domain-containing protein n=1 Tax=Haemaphysalis longicornis TaxID=44386 RepID=A0A9J6GPM7_HAELO|nr:hypothetical protein HPB48_005803 [Haemaphysalis longicornis]